jgi:hypothetical protein
MAITEVVAGDPTLRASWVQSYYVSTVPGLLNMPTTSLNYPNPASQNVIETNVSYLLFVGPGSVTDGVRTFSWGGVNVGPLGSSSGIGQVYVSTTSSGTPQFRGIAAMDNPATFPAGSLPLAVLYFDEVNRIQRIVDMRLR